MGVYWCVCYTAGIACVLKAMTQHLENRSVPITAHTLSTHLVNTHVMNTRIIKKEMIKKEKEMIKTRTNKVKGLLS